MGLVLALGGCHFMIQHHNHPDSWQYGAAWVGQKFLKSNKIQSFLNDPLQVLNTTFEET